MMIFFSSEEMTHKFLLFLLFALSLPLSSVDGVEILSKSRLERCEKVSESDNLICEKKIVINLAVPSGSSGGEASIVAELVEVEEENSTQKMQTIRTPPVITVNKSAAYALYEITYIRDVPYKPEEYFVKTRKCEPDASAKIVKICERFLYTSEDDTQQVCIAAFITFLVDKLMKGKANTAHCLRFPGDWFHVFGIGKRSLGFSVRIEVKKGSKVSEVVVGPENRTALSNDNFLRVNLIGDFVGYTSVPSFEDFYLVIPRQTITLCIGIVPLKIDLRIHYFLIDILKISVPKTISSASADIFTFGEFPPDFGPPTLSLSEIATRSFKLYLTTDKAAKYECTAILKASDFSEIDRSVCQFSTTATVLDNGTQFASTFGTKKSGINGFFEGIESTWKKMWNVVVLLWLLHQKGFFDHLYDWWDNHFQSEKQINVVPRRHGKDVERLHKRHLVEDDYHIHRSKAPRKPRISSHVDREHRKHGTSELLSTHHPHASRNKQKLKPRRDLGKVRKGGSSYVKGKDERIGDREFEHRVHRKREQHGMTRL
ncbi:Protein HAPLESS 2 [Acorus calamus]|uniref:Protein HAPLESS 2 n=1 Tax=Acorus calamus TaxID=4465 RepID=A0AAV9FBX6_ACOCL|nr:Protein HAPLESS 2 [Acorus calamus]